MPFVKLAIVCQCLVLAYSARAQIDFATDHSPPPVKPVALDPGDVSVTLERLGPVPRLFQALRLRATIKNIGRKRIGPMGQLLCTRTAFRGPGEAEWRVPDEVIWVPGYGAFPGAMDRKEQQIALYLDPGEQVSLSWTVAVWFEYLPEKEGPPLREQTAIVHPIFSRPGKYQLKWTHPADPKNEDKRIESVCEVNVPEPAAAERDVVEALTRKPRLCAELLVPVLVPDPSEIPQLEALLKGSASYADYLHFGLARAYLRRLEILKLDQWDEATRGEARTYLEELFRNPHQDDEHLDALFFDRYLPLGPGPAHDRTIRDMIESKKGPPDKLRHATETYLSLLFPSPLDEAAGMNHHYATIASQDFPYRDASLVLLRRVLVRRGERGVERLTEILNRDYYDSWIWLYASAGELTPAQWQSVRVRDPNGGPSKTKPETLPVTRPSSRPRNQL